MTSNSAPNPGWEHRDQGEELTSQSPLSPAASAEPQQRSEPSQYRTSLAQRRACYEQAVRTAIARQFPFGEADRQTLRQLQKALKLSDDVAQAISRDIIALMVDKEARYQTLLQRYEDMFRLALEQNQRISDGERWRLTQQMSQWGISPSDAGVIEKQVRARYQADGLASAPRDMTNAAVDSPPTAAQEQVVQGVPGGLDVTQLERPPSDGEQVDRAPTGHDRAGGAVDAPSGSGSAVMAPMPAKVEGIDGDRYGTLAELLRNEQWQKADDETYRCLLDACARTDDGWLNKSSIVEVCPRAVLLVIDRLWQRHSKGQFGFSIQREIFLGTASQHDQPTQRLMAFGKDVDWLLWDNSFFGFKYYRQLTFAGSAPRGHLPAKWFWKIPWQEALKCGGLGAGRGGCGKDDGILSALYDSLGDTQAVG